VMRVEVPDESDKQDFNLAGYISHANIFSFSWIDWISDTRSQRYNGLQSLVKWLDRRDNVIVCKILANSALAALKRT